MATYRPTFKTQLVTADPFRSYNCLAYSFAMAADRYTLGGMHLSGRVVRALTDEPVPSPDSPGLNLGQLEKVSKVLHIPFTRGKATTDAQLKALLNQGRAVIITGTNAKLAPSLRGDPNYLKGHALILNQMHTDGVNVLFGNPLFNVWKWVPISQVFPFWRSLGREYLATRITPSVS